MKILLKNTGREIEILTETQVRYSGTLKAYNKEKETITLSKAISHGTEARESKIRIPACPQVYEFIVFKVSKVEKLKAAHKWVVLGKGRSVPKREGPRDASGFLCTEAVPNEKYDFQKNNEKLERREHTRKHTVLSYNPEFFYDTLS